MVAATSRPDLIDAALLRPGRLDRLIFCGKCAEGRAGLCGVWLLHLVPCSTGRAGALV